MKKLLSLLLLLVLLSSCTSRDEIAFTSIQTTAGEVIATLYSEDFFNPDGLVRRTILLEYANSGTSEWELHTAHYSDEVSLKILEFGEHSYLIAEDSTGYSAWDLQAKRVVAETTITDSGDLPESGTARDYMVHTVLSREEWTKVLGLKPAAGLSLTNIDWR